jgi:hypothetical protein
LVSVLLAFVTNPIRHTVKALIRQNKGPDRTTGLIPLRPLPPYACITNPKANGVNLAFLMYGYTISC